MSEKKRHIQDIKVKRPAVEKTLVTKRPIRPEPAAVPARAKEAPIEERSELQDRSGRARRGRSVRTALPRRKRVITLMGAFVALVVLIMVGGGALLHRVVVTVVPVTETFGTTSIVNVGVGDASGDIPGYLMRIDEEVSRPVTADSFEEVTEYATGSITIYNNEKTEQKLREETRFESTDGLIFKLPKGPDVVVPAATGSTPGSVVATVIAEQPGPEYNIAPGRFVIPGWREIKNPKFDTQYAESSESMAGGFAGTRPVVTDAQIATLYDEMRAELEERLATRRSSEVPVAEFVLFEGALLAQIPDTVSLVTDDKGSRAVLAGDMYGVLFNRNELINFLYDRSSLSREAHAGSQLEDLGFDELSVQIQSIGQLASSPSMTLAASVSGTVTGAWIADAHEIQTALAGTRKKGSEDRLKTAFSDINEVKISVRPGWKAKVPQNSERVSVRVDTDSIDE